MIPYKAGDTLVHRGWTYKVHAASSPDGTGDQVLSIERIDNTLGVGFGISGILASSIDPYGAPLGAVNTAAEAIQSRDLQDHVSELKDQLGRARSDIKELRRASLHLVTCVNNMIQFMGPTMAKKFKRLYGIPDVDITEVGR